MMDPNQVCINTHLIVTHQQTAFIQPLTLTDDQLIKFILAATSTLNSKV